MQITINRNDIILRPDPSRVIARFYSLERERSKNMIRMILRMSEHDAREELVKVLRDFSTRHRSISKIFKKNFNKVSHLVKEMDINPDDLDEFMKSIIGAYFTKEYSIESAAFFNPSIVEDPDQSELKVGEKRVLLSYRATGEGHISSIVFRRGILDKNANLRIEKTGSMLDEAESIKIYSYNKELFIKSLDELHHDNQAIITSILSKLGEKFTYDELKDSVDRTKEEFSSLPTKQLFFDEVMWLASSHYEIYFSYDTAISERVIFPVSLSERNGIEDARFVKFTDDDGEVTYYATYTAYDGVSILPKLIETKNFYHFKITPINGNVGRNKGMALFPRKINGKYAMLCRVDGINNYITFSDNINMWEKAELLQKPKYPWEIIQIGNCGSPLETKEGWLVLTHAVGPMREYVIGASLFELDNPSKEIGRLKSPLMIPNAKEREGYVPNVLYTCGAIIHNNMLGIPYAMSDLASTFATVNLDDLLSELLNSK